MKDVTFYLEYPSIIDKRGSNIRDGKLGNHSGNIIATVGEVYVGNQQLMIECFSAVLDTPNSFVNFGSCSLGYLKDRCKRVSEELAREIHPALFERLDED